MSAPSEKKHVKCGACGELGHNKRTCPKNKTTTEPSKEVSDVVSTATPVSTSIYVITVSDWCNGRVDTDAILCASPDAVYRKLKSRIEWYNETYGDRDDSEVDGDGRDEYPNIVYYRNEEQFREITVPTKEQIETVLNNKRYNGDVLINIGNILSAISFALQISVGIQTLHS